MSNSNLTPNPAAGAQGDVFARSDQISYEIGKLISMANGDAHRISRPSSEGPISYMTALLTWDCDGELAID